MNEKQPKRKEIKYHQELLNWIDERFEWGKDYDTWGSAGPDIVFLTRSILGEVKPNDSDVYYKKAFEEVRIRTNPQFLIDNFMYFFICTDKHIRIYKTSEIDWDEPLNTPSVSFDFDKKSKEGFLDFIDGNCHKICIDAHLPEVLDWLLRDDINIETDDILKIVCNIGTKPTYLNKGILFNPGCGDNELLVQFKNSKTVEILRSELIEKYYIRDTHAFKDYIKHNYSSHLKDSKKSNLGKYYTPKKLVELVQKMVEPYITEETYVLDLCCGCGAFLELFNDCKIIGRDCDPGAIYILEFLGFENIEIDNTLKNVSRSKYGLSDDDDIVIIGNPPYNDTDSLSKKYGIQKKTKCELEIDKDIKTRDLGRNFLNAYAKLNPSYICVLHPLSYLIKETNFKSLKIFSKKYKLLDATIFSSNEFSDLSKKQPFPVVAAIYEKNSSGMNYNYIKDFEFKILDSIDIFRLSKFEMITTEYMKKSASSNVKKSDINLYNYNIRDINSVVGRGNLEYSETPKQDFLTVNFNELHKYCYINMMKYFFPNNYLFGNLEPLFERDRLEGDEWLRDLMIMGTIIWQQNRIPIFNYRDKKKCILFTKMLVNKYRKRAKDKSIEDNIYKIFIDIVDNEVKERENEIFDRIHEYFVKLTAPYFPNTIL